MKKLILVSAALSMSVLGWAQKKNVNTAEAALGQQEYEEAKVAIDAAVKDESTKADPKAWFVRGNVYYALVNVEKYKSQNPVFEAAMSYAKVMELDPGYKKDEMTSRLEFTSRVYAQQGDQEYQNKNYQKANDYYSKALDIHNLDNGKRYKDNKAFDTAAVITQYGRGLSYYFNAINNKVDGDYDKAEMDLAALKDNPIISDPKDQVNIYLALANIYETRNRKADLEKVVSEGRKKFPEDKSLRNRELNIYMASGKQDELLKKLEEAAAKEPDNAELQYNLGNGYTNKAFAKGADGKDMKPANYNELVANAEKAYLAMLANDKSGKPEYQYNMGVLYFNQAADVNKQMNAVMGTSQEEMKKYDQLKAQRDALFTKALPYLDKAYQSLDSRAASLSQDDKVTYQGTMIALKEIYARQDNKEKVAELKKKLAMLK